MKRLLIGHIFTNANTKFTTLFEHVNKDGQITYYPCAMKIPDGQYRVKIKNGKLVSCWKYRKPAISVFEIQKALRDFDRLTKDWKILDP